MLAQETMEVPEDGLNPPPTEVVSKDSVRTRTDLEHRLTYVCMVRLPESLMVGVLNA